MDSKTEKLCLDEIDHLVLDADKKINLQYVSNTWGSPFKNSEAILQKWLKNYSGKKKIVKEYMIRGTDKNGNAVITIVPESKLDKIKVACPNHKQFLYSIEVASENGRTLDIPETADNKFIALKLDLGKRDIKVSDIVVPPPVKKQPEPKKNTLFGAAKPKASETKTEKTSPSSSKATKSSSPKKESPKKESPKKNQSTAKKPQGKSIANFFGSKPSSSSSAKSSTNKSVAETTIKIEKVQIKEEPSTSSDSKPAQKPHKRNHSNTDDSTEENTSDKSDKNKSKPSTKKIKLEPKTSRSRLMQICDSSDDEDEPPKKEETMDVDEEVSVKKEKENKTPSPDKNQRKESINGSSSAKRRGKKKKMVTRTYEDDDGFINTVREMELVSCSDDEEEEIVEAPAKKSVPASTTSTTNGKKKISPPPAAAAGKKQGSILNFFSKK